MKRASGALADDFGRDLAKTIQAEGAGRAGRQIKHPAMHIGAAVVDGDDDGAAAMADAQLGAERQRAVRAGHLVLVEALARGGLAAGLVAIGRGDAGEAVTGLRSRGHGRIGLPPGLAAVAVRSAADVVEMMTPGVVAGLAEASVAVPPTSRVTAKMASAVFERVTIPAVDLLVAFIQLSLKEVMATYVASETPVPFWRARRFALQYGVN